ncbi:MAG TPA: hypothetical protein VNG51_01275, partial [Ktedonobacteraceae bacterium]|nr:hypothetical protein [Ktedonobacteraceae bacterium]
KCANESEEFAPQSTAGSVQSLGVVGIADADILAREAPDQQVNGGEVVRSTVADIAKAGNMGPMPGKDRRRILVYLHLPQACQACAFKAKIKAADPREKRTEG